MSPVRLKNITPSSVLTYIFLGIIVLLLISYMLFQARLLIAGPQITLDVIPKTLQTKRQISLTGVAENITDITLNGRHIVTDKEGHFNESIVLQNGYTTVSIRAHDRYGRATKLEHEFVYTPLSLLLN
ncbi:hypothetical protein N8083_01550 [Candidatus Pacebacteria bacterium]|nr:hypothetical protein [Candidatus Paceibacterota bacterium]